MSALNAVITVHYNIHCGTPLTTTDHDDFVYRDYASADYAALDNNPLSVYWQSLLVNSYDVHMYWNNFMCVVNTVTAMFLPLKHAKSLSSKVKRRYPYFIRQLFR